MTQQQGAGGNGGGPTLVVPPVQDFVAVGLQGSIQQVLSENIGRYVCVEFLVGSDTTAIKSGILYDAGVGYIVLYDEVNQNFLICDAFSIKFVTVYPTPAAPPANIAPTPNVTPTPQETEPSPQSAPPQGNAEPQEAQPPQTQTPPTPTPQQSPLNGLQMVSANRAQAQAAFNYAKRKTRR